MKYKVSFNNEGTYYDVIPNIKIVEKLTSELDMFEFTLSTLSYKLDFDFKKNNGLIKVKLYGYISNVEVPSIVKTMYLTYYKWTQVAFNPNKYQCLIQATSPTFELQRISLPNKLITQPITNNKRTIYEEFIKIMEVYASDWNIDDNLQSLLNVPCPELQFVKATLHEVLIGLFSVVNLIPIARTYKTLSYYDLTQINSNYLSSEQFIRVESSNNISNYADALDYDIENAISVDEDIITTSIAPTSDEALITDENFYWKLPSDIYELKKVIVKGNFVWDVLGPGEHQTTTDIDITKAVVSSEIYNTLKTSNLLENYDLDYKRNNLYYENNTIKGGGYHEGILLGGESLLAIINVLTSVLRIETGTEVYAVKYGTNANDAVEIDPRSVIIEVEYKSDADNLRALIVKKGINKPLNNMISNQDESYIDIINFGKQKKELINRMGNELILAQAKYDINSFYNIPKLQDSIDDIYVITQREMLLNENTMIANYTLSKDYLFETGYSGLNQLKRFFSIDTQRTVIRNDVFLYNLQFDFTKNNNEDYLIQKCINNYGEQSNGATTHFIETRDKDLISLTPAGYMIVSSQNKPVADSIVCKIGFESNVKIGDGIDDTSISGKHIKVPYKYTDDNGEFKYLDWHFDVDYVYDKSDFNIVKKFPLATVDRWDWDNTRLLINKDNREITNVTMQFRFLGNNDSAGNEIIVYDDFVKYTRLTKHDVNNLKVYRKTYTNLNQAEYEAKKYRNNSIIPMGEEITNINLKFGFDENNNVDRCVLIENGLSGNLYTFNFIGITDENDNLLLGINYYQTTTNNNIKLYLNKI